MLIQPISNLYDVIALNAIVTTALWTSELRQHHQRYLHTDLVVDTKLDNNLQHHVSVKICCIVEFSLRECCYQMRLNLSFEISKDAT